MGTAKRQAPQLLAKVKGSEPRHKKQKRSETAPPVNKDEKEEEELEDEGDEEEDIDGSEREDGDEKSEEENGLDQEAKEDEEEEEPTTFKDLVRLLPFLQDTVCF
jgi:hypothetical protein